MADNRIPSSEFRTTYSSLSEPVEVTVLGRVIGTYYPRGRKPDYDPDAIHILLTQRDAANAEIKYLKSELAKRLTTKVESTSPVETFAPKTAVRAGRKVSPGFIATETSAIDALLNSPVIKSIHLTGTARGQAGFGHSSPAPKGKS